MQTPNFKGNMFEIESAEYPSKVQKVVESNAPVSILQIPDLQLTTVPSSTEAGSERKSIWTHLRDFYSCSVDTTYRSVYLHTGMGIKYILGATNFLMRPRVKEGYQRMEWTCVSCYGIFLDHNLQ